MPRAAYTVRLAARLALALLAAGCSKKMEKDVVPGSDASVGATEQLAPLRAGVKVPIPPGWSALVAADGSFQAGPLGEPVLRVDVRRGEGAKMPTVEALTASIRQQFSGFQLSLDQEEGDEQMVLVRVTLASKLPDGGPGSRAPMLLGARRLGDDLFLCATLPGANSEDVRLSTEACRNILVQPAP